MRTITRIEKQLESNVHENNISAPKFHVSSEWTSSTHCRLAHRGTY
jgi:hypothetical protein